MAWNKPLLELAEVATANGRSVESTAIYVQHYSLRHRYLQSVWITLIIENLTCIKYVNNSKLKIQYFLYLIQISVIIPSAVIPTYA